MAGADHTDGAGAVAGRRIVVVGPTSAGKSTLARRLAALLDVPHVEIDALYWGPNWTPAPAPELRAAVAGATAGDRWVADGNYRTVRDVLWPRADTLIWLNYGLPFVLWRLTRRTLGRLLRQEVLWNGNRESWRGTFFSRESLFLWVLQSHGRRRRDYPRLLERPEYAHLTVVELTSPRATEAWIEAFAARTVVAGPTGA